MYWTFLIGAVGHSLGLEETLPKNIGVREKKYSVQFHQNSIANVLGIQRSL
jgi:hypothetical protein